jgi:hypothetical protein
MSTKTRRFINADKVILFILLIGRKLFKPELELCRPGGRALSAEKNGQKGTVQGDGISGIVTPREGAKNGFRRKLRQSSRLAGTKEPQNNKTLLFGLIRSGADIGGQTGKKRRQRNILNFEGFRISTQEDQSRSGNREPQDKGKGDYERQADKKKLPSLSFHYNNTTLF